MRNLKRALSMALAAVMLVGMMVFGASAAEYRDNATIAHEEAVDVLTALDVVGGDENGDYRPDSTLTRAEFCVMIANALTGSKFEKALFEGTATPFTDVQGHWGAAYIAYCYSVGVIAGTSATTFSPDATLTAAQAEAILLSALGYNKNNEFGANGQFELNVTSWAQRAGLTKGLSVSASAGISRDNTAQLIFNALVNTTPVGYSSLTQAYYTLGSSAVGGVVYSGDLLDPDVSLKGNGSVDDYYNNYYDRTLGFTNFGLQYGGGNGGVSYDDFGRPGHTWISNNDANIGTYANTPVLVYTASVKADKLEKDLKGYDLNTETSYYVDGAENHNASGAADIAKMSGNGTSLEIYANKQGIVTEVVAVNTYLAYATADYDENDETLSIDLIDGTVTLNDSNLSNDDFAVSTYNEDDYLLVNVAESSDGNSYVVKSVSPANVLSESTVSIVTSGKDITIDGTKYTFNDNAAGSKDKAGNGEAGSTSVIAIDGIDIKAGNVYDVLLDDYGYVIGVKENTNQVTIDDYVFIKDAAENGFDKIAKLVFMDGTSETVTVGRTAAPSGELTDVGRIGSAVGDGVLAAGNFATYRIRGNAYDLTYVDTYTSSKGIDPANGARPIGGVTNPGNAKTVFVAKDVAYNGVTNAPKVDADATVYYTLTKAGYLEAVYTGVAGKTVTTAEDLVYVLGTNPSVGKDADGISFYVYDVIMNGAKTTLSTSTTVNNIGLYIIESYTDGYADLKLANGDEYKIGAVSVAYKDGTLSTDKGAYTLADDVQVFTVDGATVKTINATGINAQVDKGFNTVTFVLSSANNDAKAIIVYLVKPQQ